MPTGKGISERNKLRKFIKMYMDYPRDLIMVRLNISSPKFDSLLNDAIREKIVSRDFVNRVKLHREMADSMENEPFSYDEDDYGNLRKKTFITREGLLVFGEQPEPIAEPTELSVAIKRYTNTLDNLKNEVYVEREDNSIRFTSFS